MSHSAMTAGSTGDSAQRAHAVSFALFLATFLALAVRITVSPALLDRVYDYVSQGGAFYEKIHVGTYLLVLLVPVALLSRPVFLRGEEIVKFRDLVRFTGLLGLLIVFLVGTGRAGAIGNLVDTYFVAGATGLILLAQNPSYRRLLGDAVILINLLSAAMGLFEATTHIRFFPYSEGEAAFRPIGLAGHPLTLGLLCATTMAFVPLTAWKPWVRIAAMLLLFVATAAAGARLALIVATLEVLALVLIVPRHSLNRPAERKAKLAVLILVTFAGAALFAVLAAGGLLSRFSEGLADKNVLARTNIYQVFDYVGWQDVVFGRDITEITRIVNDKLHLPFIESAPVNLTFQLGLVLAIPFALLVAWLILRLLRRQPRTAWIGTAVFLLAALSNNTLSEKTGVVTVLVVLLVAYLEAVPGQAARTPAGRPRTLTSS
ncbi:MAG: VpsF family polysaccharide biosynthesis protein [Devosia sp.]|uniref:VpsF family polysaccharide biosynthesis protein n=1 Tax=Devosia sp. TaxID=1871048 RepID=UPI001AC7B05B|nr:VpsF family polysaccharide biosynthesis protein [Devosia sp.]MBN9315480.1 VpsF family polysaccharide biosynthesis protein [Devosia sp.]